MLIRKISLVAVAIAVLAPSAHATNLVLNGNFGTGDYTDWTLSGDSSGDYVTSGQITGSTFQAALTTNADDDGYLSQSLATTTGQKYQLSFVLAGDGRNSQRLFGFAGRDKSCQLVQHRRHNPIRHLLLLHLHRNGIINGIAVHRRRCSGLPISDQCLGHRGCSSPRTRNVGRDRHPRRAGAAPPAARLSQSKPLYRKSAAAALTHCPANTLDNPALRRVGLGHLAGGDSPRGSPWNGCGWAAVTLNGVVNHPLRRYVSVQSLDDHSIVLCPARKADSR